MKKISFLIVLAFALNIAKAQVPTWNDNIACIVYTHCTNCHNPNGIAPSAYINYQDVLPYRFGIQTAVNNKIMPPYPPDLNYQRYAHEKYLTDQEIDLINQWVNGGAPEGDVANLPTPPVYAAGSQLQQVDISVKMSEYTNTANDDDYRCFVLPTNLSQDKFMTAWEVIPGNRDIVHHVLVYLDTTGVARNLDAADPGEGYQSFGGIGTNGAILIGAWVPGGEPYVFPDNMGMKIYKNSDIVLQMHYPAGTIGEKDSTQFNATFSSSSNLRQVRLAPILNHGSSLVNGPLFIPANTVKTINAEFTLPANVTVLSVAPHMHLIGTSVKAFAVTPQNDTINLVKIDKWDFKWQGSYLFRKPLKIPTGSKLYSEAVYDNTMNNPYQPNNPPVDVSLGEATDDEMMLIYFAFLVYQNGDENIIYDTTSTIKTYNDCVFSEIPTATAINNYTSSSIAIYPNPANDVLHVSGMQDAIEKLTVIDVAGKKAELNLNNNQVNISQFQNGIYFVSLQMKNGDMVLRKFVKQ